MRDPLEPLPAPLSTDASSQNQSSGVSVGMGLLKTFMHQTWEGVNMGGDGDGEVSVTGRVILDRAVNSEVVEIIVSLRENPGRQSQHYLQPSSYYPTYSHPPGVGITQYGSSPVQPPSFSGTRRRPPDSDRKTKPASARKTPVIPSSNSHVASSRPSGSADKPIVLDVDEDKSTRKAGPQEVHFDDAALKEIAALLAQVHPFMINSQITIDTPKRLTILSNKLQL